MSIPSPAVTASMPDILSFVDAGLMPFAVCTSACGQLMPMSVDHGEFGFVRVICCGCQTSYSSSILQFLSRAEYLALGWRFEFMDEKPPN